jgi:hypothetical protein
MKDRAHRIRGVGGAEFVFAKRVDSIDNQRRQLKDRRISVRQIDWDG